MKLNRKKFDLARARACKGTKELEASGISRGTLCSLMAGRSARPETVGRIAKYIAFGLETVQRVQGTERAG